MVKVSEAYIKIVGYYLGAIQYKYPFFTNWILIDGTNGEKWCTLVMLKASLRSMGTHNMSTDAYSMTNRGVIRG